MAENRNCQTTFSGIPQIEFRQNLSSGLVADSGHKRTDGHVYDLHIRCYFLLYMYSEEPGYESLSSKIRQRVTTAECVQNLGSTDPKSCLEPKHFSMFRRRKLKVRYNKAFARYTSNTISHVAYITTAVYGCNRHILSINSYARTGRRKNMPMQLTRKFRLYRLGLLNSRRLCSYLKHTDNT
jgi:hypothetical protein